jgi:chromosome segregation ATPase
MSDQYSIMSQEELLTEIERLTAERDTAEGILEQLQNKFAAVTAEWADCKESDRLIERLQARVGALEAKLYRKDERIKAWKQSSDEHEARVEELEAAIKDTISSLYVEKPPYYQIHFDVMDMLEAALDKITFKYSQVKGESDDDN